jgi:hypothetical protein
MDVRWKAEFDTPHIFEALATQPHGGKEAAAGSRVQAGHKGQEVKSKCAGVENYKAKNKTESKFERT